METAPVGRIAYHVLTKGSVETAPVGRIAYHVGGSGQRGAKCQNVPYTVKCEVTNPCNEPP
eukprot:1829472-Pyramimonas_sp.AAC.1